MYTEEIVFSAGSVQIEQQELEVNEKPWYKIFIKISPNLSVEQGHITYNWMNSKKKYTFNVDTDRMCRLEVEDIIHIAEFIVELNEPND